MEGHNASLTSGTHGTRVHIRKPKSCQEMCDGDEFSGTEREGEEGNNGNGEPTWTMTNMRQNYLVRDPNSSCQLRMQLIIPDIVCPPIRGEILCPTTRRVSLLLLHVCVASSQDELFYY